MTARGRAARAKGIRFEQNLATYLGTVTTRSLRPGVWDDGGDIVIAGWLAELKNQERWSVPEWFRGVEEKADRIGSAPALFIKRPHRNDGDALLVVRVRDGVA